MREQCVELARAPIVVPCTRSQPKKSVATSTGASSPPVSPADENPSGSECAERARPDLRADTVDDCVHGADALPPAVLAVVDAAGGAEALGARDLLRARAGDDDAGAERRGDLDREGRDAASRAQDEDRAARAPPRAW